MQRKVITRRALLQTLTAAGAWLVAACSGPDEPQAHARARRAAATPTAQRTVDIPPTPTTTTTAAATPSSVSQPAPGSVTATPDGQTTVATIRRRC